MSNTFGKKKLIKDISANTLQTGITQVFGLIIFYVTSKYLSKDDFGEFNWSMAVGATAIAIASLGLDLVFVKRIARGQDVIVVSSIHFFHTLLVGAFLCAVSFSIKTFVPSFTEQHPLFFFVFLNLAIANIANSFKLCLNGLEAYKHLALLALCANVFKLAGIFLLYFTGRFSIFNVIMVYTVTSCLEFVIGYFMMGSRLETRVKPLLKVKEYKYFILESLPQLGVVLFDSALARIDWILLGILSTAAATAEYSFAYKIFELSRLPVLIIAPVLLTRFSKILGNNAVLSEKHRGEIRFFLKLEMFVVMLIPIVLASAWSPLVDYFTDNKYGSVNQTNYMILAACVPLHGLINFLWTIGFVQGQLKTILYITVIVSVLNIVSNAVLIPLYNAQGAAMAFLVCTVIQVVLYYKMVNLAQIRLDLKNVLITFVISFGAVVLSKLLLESAVLSALLALFIHIFLTFATRQLSVEDIRQNFLKTNKA